MQVRSRQTWSSSVRFAGLEYGALEFFNFVHKSKTSSATKLNSRFGAEAPDWYNSWPVERSLEAKSTNWMIFAASPSAVRGSMAAAYTEGLSRLEDFVRFDCQSLHGKRRFFQRNRRRLC